MSMAITTLIYLIAAILFILGLKLLTSPKSARFGNTLSALGMLIAVIATLLHLEILSLTHIIIAMIIGGVIGGFFAAKVAMTAMPQMVAIFNSFGGLASGLVAAATFLQLYISGQSPSATVLIAIFASLLIGFITFSGSILAFLKLQFNRFAKAYRVFLQKTVALFLLVVSIGALVFAFLEPTSLLPLFVMIVSASLLGIVLVLPIGGANMPIVIALLNAYSGLAACATGFVLDNSMLIITGSLVGASGMILTNIMCRAMNRAFYEILFSLTEAEQQDQTDSDAIYKDKVKAISADETAMLIDASDSIIIIPGYGLAVAQAQHAIGELSSLLKSKDKQVRFAIHPVAGRMPGHMNVLLAEADVPYEDMFAMEDINFEFANTDLVLVIGANDVVNPDARKTEGTPLSGMPILNADQAKTVVVIKRSLSPGFAGIANPLFAQDNASMLFGDAKQAAQELLRSVREL